MLTDLLPVAEKELRKRYNVLDIIHLHHWHHDPGGLKDHLSKFSNRRFSKDDRIIFLHFDVDFYLSGANHYPGLFLCNLQTILKDVNIANEFVLMITNHENIDRELKKLQKFYSNDSKQISYIDTELSETHYDPSKVYPTDINAELLDKKFSCLNNTTRQHRHKIIQLLKSNNLLHEGMVSCSHSFDQLESIGQKNVKEPKQTGFSYYLTTTPFRSSNENWDCTKIDQLIENKEWNALNIKLDGKANEMDTRYQFLDLQKTFLYISTETVFHYPHPYLTEKTYKAVTMKRPFIIIGPRYTLARLRRLGYQSFSNYWDESYDQIEEPNDRMIAAFEQIKMILQKPIDELKYILNDMSPILEHNFKNYMSSIDVQIDKFVRDIK